MSTVSNCANLWVCCEHWLPNCCLGQKCSYREKFFLRLVFGADSECYFNFFMRTLNALKIFLSFFILGILMSLFEGCP